MPRISTFYVIVISMYWRERDHTIPHFHAEYARQRASIAVDGTVLAGTLPARALRLVREWAALHDDELVANWNRAREHERLAPSIPFPSIIFVDDLPPLVHITDVEVIGDHELRLTFGDGLVGDVAFEEDEWRGVLAPLRDPESFSQVRVDQQLGTIVWPGDLDLAPEPLYEEARQRRVAQGSRAR